MANQKNQEIICMKPKRDIVFKAIFADPKNVSLLESLLRSILKFPDDDFKSIQLTNTELIAKRKNDKLGRLDVKLQMKSGRIVNIEIQVAKDMDMRERATFYGSKMIAGQLESGQEHAELKPVICIVITDYLLIPENDFYHNKYTLYDANTESIFTDLLEINTLELKKLPQHSDGNLLWSWLKFLNAETEEEFEMLEKTNPEIKKAVAVVKELSQDEQMREEYEAREKALRDYNSLMKQAKSQGLRQGIKEGIEQGIEQGRLEVREKAEAEKVETIKRFLKMGLSHLDVAQGAGVNIDAVLKIHEEML